MTAKNNSGSMATALEPIRNRLQYPVSEREILRVASIISADEEEDVLTAAREEVLKWAAKRAGKALPQEAWDGQEFELLSAGRTTMGTKVERGEGIVWSLRGDDPDKEVPNRIWSTEISLGRTSPDDDIKIGIRLLVNSAEPELTIEPAVPGLVKQIADVCTLIDGPVPIRSSAHMATSEQHLDILVEWLFSNARRLPIIVATGDERNGRSEESYLDVHKLAGALCGLAHVVNVPADLTVSLTEALGKTLSVFHGGVRIYEPEFNHAVDPRDHRLILGDTFAKAPDTLTSEIRKGIARESLRRTKLGHDVLSFSEVRSAAAQVRKIEKEGAGANEAERLAANDARNAALESQVEDIQGQIDQAWQLAEDESARAAAAEKQLAAAWARIAAQEQSLKNLGNVVELPANPEKWEEFAEWCDIRFSGLLSLAPTARRGLRKAVFEKVELVASCISWLATDARERFMSGGGTLANIQIFESILNAPCGSDEYSFDFQGRRLSADWHIKSGGNTRQPERCLRIYYAFDEVSQQIIISDLPAHRKSGAS